MNYTDRKINTEINTKNLTTAELSELFAEADIAESEPKNLEEIRKVLQISVNKYKAGEFSLDDLSYVCSCLYELIDSTGLGSELASDLEIGADLSYYERMSVLKDPLNVEFIAFLKSVLKYGI